MRRLTATLALLALLAAPVHAGCLGRLFSRVHHVRRCGPVQQVPVLAPAPQVPYVVPNLRCTAQGCRVR